MTTFYIQQFGCRATQADGAALERQLLDRGCTPAPDPASASIVVVNTCTVTAAADAQARDSIRKIHAQNPQARLIVTGCYAQRAPEELASLPGVSWVVGNSHKPQIPNLVTQIASVTPFPFFVGQPPTAPGLASIPDADAEAPQRECVIPSEARSLPFPPASRNAPYHSLVGAQHAAQGLAKLSNPEPASEPAQILAGDIFAHPEFLSAPVHGGESGHTRPILKIQDGCNLRCAYCVIPSVRGKSRSLPPDAVLREIQSLTSRNSPYLAREIVLSGINLGSYGRDLAPQTTLLSLLRRILDEASLERLRISSIEPQDVTHDLIDFFAGNDRIAHHFHMPLQSASDRILRAMHRRYRVEHYARRLDLIHDRLPNAAIGADVIAGFPGETEADHAATLDFIGRHPFTYLHVFSYSSRPGTESATSSNQVPSHIIKRRARELRALGESKSAAFRRSQQGRTLRVLTLHRDEHSLTEPTGAAHTLTEPTGAAHTPALSSNYLRVQVPGIFSSNEWMDVAIKSEEGNYLVAEPTPAHSYAELSVPSALSASSV